MGGQKDTPINFSPVASTNVGLGYDNFSHRNATLTKLWSHDRIYNII